MDLPLIEGHPPLKYDDICNWDGCGQPATHRVSVRCGEARIHLDMVVCVGCAPEIVVNDVVPINMWDEFEPLVRVGGEEWAGWYDCKVYLTPLRGPARGLEGV